MSKFIKKIKQFFQKIFSKNKIKQIEAPNNAKQIGNTNIIKEKKIEEELNNNQKKEFFEIYNEIKNDKYNLNNLTKEQAKKVITMLNAEIDLKQEKLNKNITELNILKTDNAIEEKNRILNLYKEIRNENIDLSEVDKEDLLKIRKLLLEEAKIQDEKLGSEIILLQKIKKVS